MSAPRKGIHPGDYISEEIEERGWNRVVFRNNIGWSARMLDEVIRGRVPITSPMAMDLAAVFGTSRILWLRLQDAWQAALKEER